MYANRLIIWQASDTERFLASGGERNTSHEFHNLSGTGDDSNGKASRVAECLLGPTLSSRLAFYRRSRQGLVTAEEVLPTNILTLSLQSFTNVTEPPNSFNPVLASSSTVSPTATTAAAAPVAPSSTKGGPSTVRVQALEQHM